MIFLVILFIVGFFIGIKIAKKHKQKKSVPIEEGGVPTIEAEEVKEPIKAIKIGGIRIDIKELKEKSSHLCEGLRHIIEIER